MNEILEKNLDSVEAIIKSLNKKELNEFHEIIEADSDLWNQLTIEEQRQVWKRIRELRCNPETFAKFT